MMATFTDLQAPPTSPHNLASNVPPQSPIDLVSPSLSRPPTANSNRNRTTSQSAPIGPGEPSRAIQNGANSILDIIRAERKQAVEDAQRQIIFLQHQHNERQALYTRGLVSACTKQRDAESMVSHISDERDRYLKEFADLQNIASQARAEATVSRGEASEATKAAEDARRQLMAVQDALQQVGITISQCDGETPNQLKVILGTPWLELIPPPISDASVSGSTDDSSPPIQHFTTPLAFISFLKKNIVGLLAALRTTRNNCQILDSQRNQLQGDLRTINFDRAELESLKKDLEENMKKLSERELRVTELENEIHTLKIEREGLVKAKDEAGAALEETKKTTAESINSLKSTLDERLQHQQHQAEAKAEKDRQELENLIEAKTAHIRDLQSQLEHSSSTSQDSIVDLRKLNYLARENVKSRDAAIKDSPGILAVSSTCDVTTTESAPKDNSDGSSADNQVRACKSSTSPDQLHSRAQHIFETYPVAVSTGDRKSKQTPAPKKIEKKSKSPPESTLGSSISCPVDVDIDSASSTDVEIIEGPSITLQSDAGVQPSSNAESSSNSEIVTGPIPFTSEAAAKLKSLRTVLSKATSKASSSSKTGDSAPPGKTSAKRVADADDSPYRFMKRPKLSIDASATSVKDKDSAVTSNLSALTPLESISSTPSPAFLEPGLRIQALGGGTASKTAVAHSPRSRTHLFAIAANAPSAGAGGGIKDDVRCKSGSAFSETQNGPPKQLAAKSVTKRHSLLLKHSKKQAKFRNFDASVPAKDQPSVSLARPSAEQQQGAHTALSATSPVSKETLSPSSGKDKPPSPSQPSGDDHPSAPSSNTPSSKHISTSSAKIADPDNSPCDSPPEPVDGSAQPPASKPVPTGPRASMAASRVNEESPHKAPWGPKSAKPTGRTPRGRLIGRG